MTADFEGSDFVNWPATIDFRPRKLFAPASVVDVADFIKTATRNDRRVRAIGSAWSMSDAEVANDYLITGPELGSPGNDNFFGSVLAMSQGSQV